MSCKPDLILADEPTTALDVTIQAQIVALLKTLAEDSGAAVLFVTHDLGLVARFAQKVAVMYAGRFVEYGPIREVFASPQHPYTRGLLRSIPSIKGSRGDTPGADRGRAAGHEGAGRRLSVHLALPGGHQPLRRRAAAADACVARHHSAACWVTDADRSKAE